jgi:hypothetical protein
MKIIMFLLVLFSIQFISCRNQTNIEIEKKNDDYINKIVIQNYPSFHLPSLLVLDIENQEIIFQRIGNREFLEVTPLPEGKVIKTLAPKSYRFRIDSSNFNYLKDSIIMNFSFEDFEDKEEDVHDGIGNSILYIFESGKIEDIELSNSYTENQIRLLNYLILLTEKVHPDSLSRIYLNRLNEYYD